ncbi:MAG TPA: arginine--tRNA ligase, partial [Gammaproteobacteria bacterium]|nr:arginine--tRNA ligase [Gammaproteobacteria bacterium]
MAGPGFINFIVDDVHIFAVIEEIRRQAKAYGRSTAGAGRKVQIEFVSANPTGPLHIGHGRGAAIGSVIANLLDATGHDVCREYYVNDAGRQMDILALSVFVRYLQACAVDIELPAQAYQGDYVIDIASALRAEHGDAWRTGPGPLLESIAIADPERALDASIAAARMTLGAESFEAIRTYAKDVILDGIKADLQLFGVRFDVWYSESELARLGLVDDALEILESRGHLYTEEGARWFRSQALGDEKNRVVVRDNGLKTYFASD